jgi:hypothetical protein
LVVSKHCRLAGGGFVLPNFKDAVKLIFAAFSFLAEPSRRPIPPALSASMNRMPARSNAAHKWSVQTFYPSDSSDSNFGSPREIILPPIQKGSLGDFWVRSAESKISAMFQLESYW